MSKRLQVLLDERDLDEIRELANRERLTVADWAGRRSDEKLYFRYRRPGMGDWQHELVIHT